MCPWFKINNLLAKAVDISKKEQTISPSNVEAAMTILKHNESLKNHLHNESLKNDVPNKKNNEYSLKNNENINNENQKSSTSERLSSSIRQNWVHSIRQDIVLPYAVKRVVYFVRKRLDDALIELFYQKSPSSTSRDDIKHLEGGEKAGEIGDLEEEGEKVR